MINQELWKSGNETDGDEERDSKNGEFHADAEPTERGILIPSSALSAPPREMLLFFIFLSS